MASRQRDLDLELQRLHRRPLAEFTRARNDLAKQLRKLGRAKEGDYVRTLAKPTPSAWAVNMLFEREPEKMETLLAAGKRARAGQREAVSGRGAEPLRESLKAARALMEDLRLRGAGVLAESGHAATRTMLERLGTNLQALAFSPASAEAASRRWLSRDLDPPGFEVLAGLQLAGAPVVDLATRRAKREAGRKPERQERTPEASKTAALAKKPARDSEREDRERQRQEAAERARREREEERIRRRVAAAQEKVESARAEADSLRAQAEQAEQAVAVARRQLDAAQQAAERTREKADRAAERLARAREELEEARGEGR